MRKKEENVNAPTEKQIKNAMLPGCRRGASRSARAAVGNQNLTLRRVCTVKKDDAETFLL
jgi:hypothetical protein